MESGGGGWDGGWGRFLGRMTSLGSCRCRRAGACIIAAVLVRLCAPVTAARRAVHGALGTSQTVCDWQVDGTCADVGVWLISQAGLISTSTDALWWLGAAVGSGGGGGCEGVGGNDTGQQGRGGPVRQDALLCLWDRAGPGVQSCAHLSRILCVINTSL